MMHLSYVLLGLAAGIFGGLMGLGGGIILIPALVYMFGLTQHQAQGTSLAIMVPPITLLAAIRYYKSGNVKLDMAVLIALGFIAGGLLGADIVQGIPDLILKKIFGFMLLFVAVKMILFT
ncbi:MAG: permease [Omnitrophica bacterium RIFCSPLOWO2_02_FULL_45_16]|nr:MAG: permease [Omnitrophica bacterium RIFCSPLOWO2_01_FULL_45_24]OGW94049.1 MAG: permease [Omnitrophica bacterium RIFCSPLOWO2_12_FULL_45_13]OGX00889.1 MAG: permease [Omnitrophica bacterium RIFCSPLOWO2_02_FULL_45_16]